MTVKVMVLLLLAIANPFSLNANIGGILSVPPLKNDRHFKFIQREIFLPAVFWALATNTHVLTSIVGDPGNICNRKG